MEKNTYPGRFIVFEGLDGSGQSTQAGLLKDFLSEKGYQVVLTKEPTFDSEAGKKIREILDEKIKLDPFALQKLFAEDRREHLKNIIIPALKEGKFVISGRYFYSSFAFGSSDGVDLEWLIKINYNFLTPDLTLILKVRPEVCLARINNRGKAKTLFEKQEKMARTWNTFEILPKNFPEAIIINGEKSIPDVFEEVKKVFVQNIKICTNQSSGWRPMLN